MYCELSIEEQQKHPRCYATASLLTKQSTNKVQTKYKPTISIKRKRRTYRGEGGKNKVMSMDELDIDFDDILNPEDEYYQQGYKEGQEQSARQQLHEGKQFGYQTGYQRFLIVGYIQQLVDDWERSGAGDKYDNWTQLQMHISLLRDLIGGIKTSNEDDDVAVYESNLKKARNKLRVIVGMTREFWKINTLDKIVEEVGGTLQVSENLDEMW